jgi:hypothetical protein
VGAAAVLAGLPGADLNKEDVAGLTMLGTACVRGSDDSGRGCPDMVRVLLDAGVDTREQQIGGSGGSLEPPGPLS